MATQKVTLKPFNTVTLAVGTQYNLVAPGPGRYFANLVADTGPVAISNANTVSPTDPNSFQLPQNVPYTPQAFWGPDGIWVATTAANSLSVALASRGQ